MASPSQAALYDTGTTSNMAGSPGYCAMRGSCGPKDWVSKPLPCPLDEPASDVRSSTIISLVIDLTLVTLLRRMWTVTC